MGNVASQSCAATKRYILTGPDGNLHRTHGAKTFDEILTGTAGRNTSLTSYLLSGVVEAVFLRRYSLSVPTMVEETTASFGSDGRGRWYIRFKSQLRSPFRIHRLRLDVRAHRQQYGWFLLCRHSTTEKSRAFQDRPLVRFPCQK